MTRSRSGLVLAVMRSLMAALFAVWLWLAPHHHAQGGLETVWLFGAYLVFALVMLAVAAQSWWYDFRLARAAFAVDVATFLVGLYLTEAVTLDFFSSFMAFFAFLMLNSATRWSRRSILMIAVGLAACFLLAGLLVEWGEFHFDTTKFIRRFSTLALLSLMLGWFAFNRQSVPVARYIKPDPAQEPLAGVLEYAMGAYGAAGGAIAWAAQGETRPVIRMAGTVADGLKLAAVDAPLLAGGMVFDYPRSRALGLNDQDRMVAMAPAPLGGLIAGFAGAQGLSLPIVGRTGRGQLVLTGIAGLNCDDLFAAKSVVREIAAAMDEEETEAMARELAMSRLRTQIAADLHDSVVQTLAGAKFRLEALRYKLAQGMAAPDDIDLLCAGLADEQSHVRAIIERLRQGQIQPGRRDLMQELPPLADQLCAQWLVAVSVVGEGPVIVPTALNFEIQQILREATANAARHGGARHVRVELGMAWGRLIMAILDDGSGFAPDAQSGPPQSIAARVARLGGDLTVGTIHGQTRVLVTLPMEHAG
ncbi:sensor histidine kinase [Novosphingobium sediminicola]|uniref:Signal transduction histidine kinase n=1 Tax=Novosphingobium sediminicola TaxID=563162 RepID=A0A7W6CLM4_9SPHN|nr:histidine kinase [Novosphingobium sediminicola]MBB3955236.1 signal transduction histidine kinase [Novosphingobium sediminicola]